MRGTRGANEIFEKSLRYPFLFPPPLWLLTSLLCLATAVTEGMVFHYMFNSDVLLVVGALEPSVLSVQ